MFIKISTFSSAGMSACLTSKSAAVRTRQGALTLVVLTAKHYMQLTFNQSSNNVSCECNICRYSTSDSISDFQSEEVGPIPTTCFTNKKHEKW